MPTAVGGARRPETDRRRSLVCLEATAVAIAVSDGARRSLHQSRHRKSVGNELAKQMPVRSGNRRPVLRVVGDVPAILSRKPRGSQDLTEH